MIVKVEEKILKDGGHVYYLTLAKEPEESAESWSRRFVELSNSVPNISYTTLDKGKVTITLHLLPGVEEDEFNPGRLSEADLIRELGAIDSKQPGQVNRNAVKYD